MATMLSLGIYATGVAFTMHSAHLGHKLDAGSRMELPRNPWMVRIVTIASGWAATVALIGGFWLGGWLWLAALPCIVIVGLPILILLSSRTWLRGLAPAAAIVFGVAGMTAMGVAAFR